MARIVWTEPALQDLESIADFGDFLDWVQSQQRYQTCLTGN